MTPIKYKLASMEVTQSKLTPENYNGEKSVTMNNSFSFGMSKSDNTILRVTHILELYSNDDILANIILQTFVKFNEDSIKGMINENKLEIPRDFLVQCGSISYGSMRGVVVEETKKVGLPNIVLPPYYIDTLVKESLVVDLSTKE